jgi:hypothetical protein
MHIGARVQHQHVDALAFYALAVHGLYIEVHAFAKNFGKVLEVARQVVQRPLEGIQRLGLTRLAGIFAAFYTGYRRRWGKGLVAARTTIAACGQGCYEGQKAKTNFFDCHESAGTRWSGPRVLLRCIRFASDPVMAGQPGVSLLLRIILDTN